MKVALCDDEKKDLDDMTLLVREYTRTDNLEIFPFSDGPSLLSSAIHQIFDVVILDIEMPQLSGYDTALRLQQMSQKPLIVFLTNSMAYTLRGYGVAFRYLVKPMEREHLYAALDAAFREVCANRYIFSADGTSCVLRIEEIYYFEVFNHYIVLHTFDAEYSFRSSLKDILRQLPAGCFGLPHQSYLVNYSHVKTATTKEVCLSNGVHIPISRRKQHEFEKRFHIYLGR